MQPTLTPLDPRRESHAVALAKLALCLRNQQDRDLSSQQSRGSFPPRLSHHIRCHPKEGSPQYCRMRVAEYSCIGPFRTSLEQEVAQCVRPLRSLARQYQEGTIAQLEDRELQQ